jgi:hypothetical protein
MRKALIAAAALAALLAGVETANAQDGRVLTGAAIGAGTGGLLAGPIGAVAGGIVGGIVGGPRFYRGFTECFRDRNTGERRCYWR